MRQLGRSGLGSEARSLATPGRGRSYRLYRPGHLSRDARAPLVLVLHGGYGSGAQVEQATGWDAVADRHGFLVAYPDGVGRSWNAGTCCGPAHTQGVDDVAFLSALIDELGAENLDPDRIFAAGVSNGAMMAYRLACDLPGRLAAIGPVGGTMLCDCPEPAPTSVLHIHGMEDRNVVFTGGVGPKAWDHRPRPSVPAVIDLWRRAGHCGPVRVTEEPPVRTEISTGPGGVEVSLIAIAGAGHVWPGGRPPAPKVAAMLSLDPPNDALDATAALWSFFSTHPRSTHPRPQERGRTAPT